MILHNQLIENIPNLNQQKKGTLVLLIPEAIQNLSNNNRNNLNVVAQGKILPTIKEFLLIVSTFGLTILAWIFFRANSIQHAFSYISEIFSTSLFTSPDYFEDQYAKPVFILILIFVIIEWIGRDQKYAIASLGLKWKRSIRYALYYAIIITIFWFSGEEQQFIYFQF